MRQKFFHENRAGEMLCKLYPLKTRFLVIRPNRRFVDPLETPFSHLSSSKRRFAESCEQPVHNLFTGFDVEPAESAERRIGTPGEALRDQFRRFAKRVGLGRFAKRRIVRFAGPCGSSGPHDGLRRRSVRIGGAAMSSVRGRGGTAPVPNRPCLTFFLIRHLPYRVR